MTTSTAMIQAAHDYDVQERATALAAELGVDNPEGFVRSNLAKLAVAPVNDSGDTVASVYEYLQAEFEKKQAALVSPGKDLGGLTDDHLRHALKSIQG